MVWFDSFLLLCHFVWFDRRVMLCHVGDLGQAVRGLLRGLCVVRFRVFGFSVGLLDLV